MRAKGISVLISAHNEEYMLPLCVESFFQMADEIILVENNSVDRTREVAYELARKFKKVQAFSIDVSDLWQNRQFALDKSKFSWAVRADADYVCRIPESVRLRNWMLSQDSAHSIVIKVPQINIIGAFDHTTAFRLNTGLTKPMFRFFTVSGGLRFIRRGRREFFAMQGYRTHTWGEPIWFHCTLKSARTLLFRSFRSRWRGEGKFQKYPTVESYVRAAIPSVWGTDDIEEAARRFVRERIVSRLVRYDSAAYYPYTLLIKKAMRTNPGYKVVYENDKPVDLVPC